ncbi:glycohydrolase toxin TNT-related protein [Haloechinothrix sp. YIM 98757]|uniref:Glycohydrolase toxin TNT-related protein n=1 Tax=Haloechinothrix aidingensis TaxID=2752311 RepID=A0A838AFW4_9PSEU|nr:glycohydrolase toxin TNT-related protein [Haloechinothrix aidingensis]MBA0128045.1 glycohydrolase toxin TNT-related protein [Haloechinothrix aidingensis]
MGIELPQELGEIAERTGLAWPEADEDAMRQQAGAWREAAEQLRVVERDADSSACEALDGMEGEAGDAARQMWSGFVHPDSGTLVSPAREATAAADRLEHAAERVAVTKVEMIERLTRAAATADAADAAARAGHPEALLGLDTEISGAASDLAAAGEDLAAAVGEVPPEGVPGTRERAPGVPDEAQGIARDAAGAPLTEPPGVTEVPERGTQVRATLHGRPARLDDIPPSGEAVREMPTPSQGVPASPGAGTAMPPGGGDSVATPPAGIPAGHATAAGVDPGAATPPAVRVQPEPGQQAQQAPPGAVPPSYRGVPGQTSLAGFADVPAGPAGAGGPGPAAPPAGPPGAGAPPGVAQPGPAQPGAAQPGGAQPGGAQPGQSQPGQGQPGGGHAGGGAGRGAQHAVPRPQAGPAAGGQHAPGALQRPVPAHGSAAGTGRPPGRHGDLALFLVHMFPIGHLPVASDRPARQVPPPAAEVDVAAGLRFPPHDHPESGRIDTSAPVTAGEPDPGAERARPAGGAGREHPAVSRQLDGYDPLGGMHERDWDRRYVVKPAEDRPEFAWPPCERYPEGGREWGEAVTVPAGTVLDRFGSEFGRVFAPDGTAFARRSLPPAHLDSGYFRYRVLCALPAWRAVSAAWFGQPGGGLRYRTVYSAGELVALGYLEDITGEALAAPGTVDAGDDDDGSSDSHPERGQAEPGSG